MKESLGAKTLAFPTPAWIVGTYDEDGKPNVMTAAWGGICCSKPPCVYVSLRQATYTYGNIVRRKAYTVSIASEANVKETDYFGVVSGRDVDKLSAAGLTPVKSDLVDAPYVKEFPLVLECRLIRMLGVGLHTLFVGEIMDVKVDPSILDEKHVPDIEKLRPIIYSPGKQVYHGVGKYLGQAFSMGKKLAG